MVRDLNNVSVEKLVVESVVKTINGVIGYDSQESPSRKFLMNYILKPLIESAVDIHKVSSVEKSYQR